MLDESDFDETDERLVQLLADGRVTPQYVADALDISRADASERLKRLVEHGHIRRLTAGLYELVDVPRGASPHRVGGDEPGAGRARLETELEECREENHDLRNEVMKKEMRLEQAADVDVAALRARLEELAAAFGREDGDAVVEAIDSLRTELEGS
jgi:DNA-binding Lrp family transcriptional regulator